MSEERYDRLERMKDSGDAAERLAVAIWADVTDRRGWRQAADQFDDEVTNDILDEWLAIIRTHYG